MNSKPKGVPKKHIGLLREVIGELKHIREEKGIGNASSMNEYETSNAINSRIKTAKDFIEQDLDKELGLGFPVRKLTEARVLLETLNPTNLSSVFTDDESKDLAETIIHFERKGYEIKPLVDNVFSKIRASALKVDNMDSEENIVGKLGNIRTQNAYFSNRFNRFYDEMKSNMTFFNEVEVGTDSETELGRYASVIATGLLVNPIGALANLWFNYKLDHDLNKELEEYKADFKEKHSDNTRGNVERKEQKLSLEKRGKLIGNLSTGWGVGMLANAAIMLAIGAPSSVDNDKSIELSSSVNHHLNVDYNRFDIDVPETKTGEFFYNTFSLFSYTGNTIINAQNPFGSRTQTVNRNELEVSLPQGVSCFYDVDAEIKNLDGKDTSTLFLFRDYVEGPVKIDTSNPRVELEGKKLDVNVLGKDNRQQVKNIKQDYQNRCSTQLRAALRARANYDTRVILR